jgi:glyoxylase-like metal-dependent hydrolase (beta-lactamase superfamily II)
MDRLRRCLPLLFAMLALVPTAASAEEIVLKPVKLTEHIWVFQGDSGMASRANKGYMSNAGFVVTRDGVLVFDALGTPALGRAMLKAIAGVTPRPVKRVIVSHYHADHIYGLQVFKAAGAEIWAHENGRHYLASEVARDRLAQRRQELAPWVDAATQVVGADRWLSFKSGKVQRFNFGGMDFSLFDASGAHSDEDLMLMVEEGRVLFAGDLYFTGRIPFVGNADSGQWLKALSLVEQARPAIAVPGHGAASRNTAADLDLTRKYLEYLRKTMGEAVENLTPFEEAYAAVDWSAFSGYPAFQAANRVNAYGTYLLMERESLQKK